MKKDQQASGKREAVGIYFDADALQKAVKDLEAYGIRHGQIGLLAGKYTVRDKLGHLYDEVNSEIDQPGAPDVAFVARDSVGDTMHAMLGSLYIMGAAVTSGAVVASAGILGGAVGAAVATAAVFGGVGTVLTRVISQSDAEHLEQQVDEGHLLLFVRVDDREQEDRVMEILRRDSAYDPRVYTVE